MPPQFLTTDQILALAPDAGSVKAGRGLASPRQWTELGQDDDALWGLCRGSGKNPYQVRVERHEPAFKCSCPSRKFPCKHALGLMLIAAEQAAAMPAAARPAWVAEWLDERAARAEKREQRAARSTVVDPTAQAERREKRQSRIEDGLELLQQWLADLVRQGFADHAVQRADWWQPMQRRLVDAQAPGLAGRVAALGELLARGPRHTAAIGDAIGRLFVLAQAGARRAALPPALAAALDQTFGVPVAKDEVLAGEPLSDRWFVAGREQFESDRLLTTVTWLRGATSGRWAQLIQSTPAHLPQADLLPLGAGMRGALCFYPGAAQRRALFPAPPQREDSPPPDAAGLHEVLAQHAARLTELPWSEPTPFIAWLRPGRCDGAAALLDEGGTALPWRASSPLWTTLLALGGGLPRRCFGLWNGGDVQLLTVEADGEWLALPAAATADDGDPAIADDWTRHQLVGTARSAQLPPPPHQLLATCWPPADTPIELATLQAASLVAAARAAGAQPIVDAHAVTPCEAERAPTCNTATGAVLRELLDGPFDLLLPECLQRLAAAGWVASPRALPALLDRGAAEPTLRSALAPALGVRGRWLAAHRPEWSWAQAVASTDAGAVDDDRPWHEGTPQQRRDWLAALHRRDPDAAGRALRDTWQETGGEDRERLLAVLSGAPPASLGDWLAATPLRDRRAAIRDDARRALLRLPDHPFQQRARERAAPLLRVEGALKKRLVVALPAAFDAEWRADGVVEKPPQGVGERAFWARQLLAAVPLSFWCDRFGVGVDKLLQWNRHDEWQELLRHAFLDSLTLLPQPAATTAVVRHYLLEDRWPERELPATGFVQQQLRELPPHDAAELLDALLERTRGVQVVAMLAIGGASLPPPRDAARLADTLAQAAKGAGSLGARRLAAATPADQLPRLLQQLATVADLSADQEQFLRVLEVRQRFLSPTPTPTTP